MLENLTPGAKDMAGRVQMARRLKTDQSKSVTFAPGTKPFNLDREQLLRRASLDAATSRHPGPSYSSILNVRRRPSKKAPSCNVMHTVHEENETKGEDETTHASKEKVDKSVVKRKTTLEKGKRKQRHKSDSDVELFKTAFGTDKVVGDRSGILKRKDEKGNFTVILYKHAFEEAPKQRRLKFSHSDARYRN